MEIFWNSFKEMLTNLMHSFGLAWWVEIVTQNPRCTYYFGPFFSAEDANADKGGYIEDLQQEGAVGISVNIKRCKPDSLTIFEDVGERVERQKKQVYSGQM